MDELKISSSLMRKLVSKVVSKIIFKKLGYKISIELNELSVKIVDGTAYVHLNTDAKMDAFEFKKVASQIEAEQ